MNAVTDDVEPILTQYSTQVNNNRKIILCNLVNLMDYSVKFGEIRFCSQQKSNFTIDFFSISR